jgi:hypothetical protein
MDAYVMIQTLRSLAEDEDRRHGAASARTGER